MEEINVVIPKDKLNDFNYIYSKLMDVKLDVLKTISKRTNRPFNELIIEFVPEIKDFNDEYILKKYSIDKNNLVNTTQLDINKKDDISIIKKDNLNNSVSPPKIIKKIIKKKTINSPTNSNLIDKSNQNNKMDTILNTNTYTNNDTQIDTNQEISKCETNNNLMVNTIVSIEENIPDNKDKINIVEVSNVPKTKKIIIKKQK